MLKSYLIIPTCLLISAHSHVLAAPVNTLYYGTDRDAAPVPLGTSAKTVSSEEFLEGDFGYSARMTPHENGPSYPLIDIETVEFATQDTSFSSSVSGEVYDADEDKTYEARFATWGALDSRSLSIFSGQSKDESYRWRDIDFPPFDTFFRLGTHVGAEMRDTYYFDLTDVDVPDPIVTLQYVFDGWFHNTFSNIHMGMGIKVGSSGDQSFVAISCRADGGLISTLFVENCIGTPVSKGDVYYFGYFSDANDGFDTGEALGFDIVIDLEPGIVNEVEISSYLHGFGEFSFSSEFNVKSDNPYAYTSASELSAAETAPIPLPSSALLLFGAFSGLTLLRRQRGIAG